MPAPDPRQEVQARVLARLQSGYTLRALCALPGYPAPATVRRWRLADPAFAARLADARAWGRGLRYEATILADRTYDEARGQAVLARVRGGERLRDLLRAPGPPNRAALDAWKRQRPDFAAALAEAVRAARALRPRRWPRYDEALADQLILRVSKGERLRDLMREPGLPGRTALRRWRRRDPAFAGALALAVRSGLRRQGGFRPDRPSLCTPDLTQAVAEHILAGGSLHSAGALPGMPHPMTLYAWRRCRPDFARDIALAEMLRDDRIADRALTLARQTTPATAAADARAVAAARQRLGQLTGRSG